MNRIRYLHIPKTAGTSLAACLARIYPGERFTFSGDMQRDLERYYGLEPTRREQLTLVSGHSPRITGIPGIDSLPTITLLRHPVDRVKSFCQHVSEGKSPDQLDRFPPEAFDLDQFLESGDEQLSNLQTKMLLGNRVCELPEADAAALVDNALHVLRERIHSFGIVEELERSLALFGYRLGWEHVPVCGRLNVGDESRLILFSDDHIARIRELNAVDLEVYEKALKLFHEDLDKIPGPRRLLIARVAPRQWRRRAASAWRIFRAEGPRALLEETQRFVRWLRA